jgi:hypothetical protein
VFGNTSCTVPSISIISSFAMPIPFSAGSPLGKTGTKMLIAG